MPLRIKPELVRVMAEFDQPFSLVRESGQFYYFLRSAEEGLFEYIVFARDGQESIAVDLTITYEPFWHVSGTKPLLGEWEDLTFLSGRSRKRDVELLWYSYGPDHESLGRTLSQIRSDVVYAAFPWFEGMGQRLKRDRVLQEGLKLARERGRLSEPELNRLQANVEAAGWLIAGLRDPAFDAFVEELANRTRRSITDNEVRQRSLAILSSKVPVDDET